MKIGIQTWGSEGDIRPFLALAAGLSKAGHAVTLVVTSIDDKDYGAIAEKYGFKLRLVASPVIKDLPAAESIGYNIVSEKHPFKQAALIMDEYFEPIVDEMYQASLDLCRDMDVVVNHFFYYPMSIAAETVGVKHVNVLLVHSFLFPHTQAPLGLPSLGAWLNPMWWKLVHYMINKAILKYPNRLRQKHNLAAINDVIDEAWVSRSLNLIAVSRAICLAQPDQNQFSICGFFNLPDDAITWEMDLGLKTFLQNGEAPVYITFGSFTPFTDKHGSAALQLFIDAVTQANCRAIIQANDITLPSMSMPDNIYFCQRLPHQQVFPHCAAVIHHGGAGTTQSATRAGAPSIIVAHIAEQEFWGMTLHQLGAAPAPLRRRSLTAKRLASRIKQVLSTPRMKMNTEKLAAQMQAEDGVQQAVNRISQLRPA